MEKITGLFAAMEISSTGLAAQRRRMTTIAENLANTSTTRTEEGGPYKRKMTIFKELQKSGSFGGALQKKTGLHASRDGHIQPEFQRNSKSVFSGVGIDTVISKAEPNLVFDPDHPDANETGYVKMPKIDTITEMVDMISASRAYEANITSIKVAKDMAKKALEI